MTERSSDQRTALPLAASGVCLAVICALVGGCATTSQRRPVAELIEEARAASAAATARQKSQQDAHLAPIVDSNVAQASGEEPLPLSEANEDVLPPRVFEGPPVSETFVENDVREALQILASQAKVAIIIDDQVRGVTSAIIEDQPFEAALESVLLPLGYVYRKVDDQYLVGLPDPESALFPRIAERFDYHATHLSSLELLNLLPENLKRFVRTSDKRNLIIVEAPRTIAERILWDLRRSDQHVQQVVLEAMVCVLTPESGLRYGLDVQQGVPFGGDSAVNMAISGLSLSGQYGPPDLVNMKNFTFTSALLKSLAREGYVSIRAAPRVMAKDGETAKISIAKETFFSIQPGNAQLLFRQDIERIEAGISLDITPVIRGDHVTVNIERAEVSEGLDNQSLAETSATNQFPIINRRKVSTTVHVLDGETITIGGLVQRQEVERISKLPFLCDIPHAGKLFQHIDRREEENEVVIFICPRIVREGMAWQEQP